MYAGKKEEEDQVVDPEAVTGQIPITLFKSNNISKVDRKKRAEDGTNEEDLGQDQAAAVRLPNKIKNNDNALDEKSK